MKLGGPGGLDFYFEVSLSAPSYTSEAGSAPINLKIVGKIIQQVYDDLFAHLCPIFSNLAFVTSDKATQKLTQKGTPSIQTIIQTTMKGSQGLLSLRAKRKEKRKMLENAELSFSSDADGIDDKGEDTRIAAMDDEIARLKDASMLPCLRDGVRHFFAPWMQGRVLGGEGGSVGWGHFFGLLGAESWGGRVCSGEEGDLERLIESLPSEHCVCFRNGVPMISTITDHNVIPEKLPSNILNYLLTLYTSSDSSPLLRTTNRSKNGNVSRDSNKNVSNNTEEGFLPPPNGIKHLYEDVGGAVKTREWRQVEPLGEVWLCPVTTDPPSGSLTRRQWTVAVYRILMREVNGEDELAAGTGKAMDFVLFFPSQGEAFVLEGLLRRAAEKISSGVRSFGTHHRRKIEEDEFKRFEPPNNCRVVDVNRVRGTANVYGFGREIDERINVEVSGGGEGEFARFFRSDFEDGRNGKEVATYGSGKTRISKKFNSILSGKSASANVTNFRGSFDSFSFPSSLLLASRQLSQNHLLALDECLSNLREDDPTAIATRARMTTKSYCSSILGGGWVVGRKIGWREIYIITGKRYESWEVADPVVEGILEALLD